MMRINPVALQIFDYPGGSLLYDWTGEAQGVRMTSAERGHESLSWRVAMPLMRAFRVYDTLPIAYVVLSGRGGDVVWEGRLEDKSITAEGVACTALGYWRAVADYGPYTQLWSDVSVSRWRLMTDVDIGGAKPERFEADNNNRLYMAFRKEEGGGSGDLCAWGYAIPQGSQREMVCCDFVYDLGAAGSGWRARLMARDEQLGGAVQLWSETAGIAAKSGAMSLSFSPAAALTFELEATETIWHAANTGAEAVLRITGLRVATTAVNRVNTTIGSGITAGTRTVTPGSMANITRGARLVITGAGGTREMVTVTAVTATTFTAIFALSHTATVAVQAIVVYGHEIIRDIVTRAAGLNSAQLSSSHIEVEGTGNDLQIELYEEVPAPDVVAYLCTEGDDRSFEAGVWGDRRLYFRPAGSQAQTWYTDVVAVDLQNSMTAVVNQGYGVYRDARRGVRRTAEVGRDKSKFYYTLSRRGFVPGSTTSQVAAEGLRDSFLADREVARPRMRVVTDGLYDVNGTAYPLWAVRAGDVMELRNLPPTLGETVDRIRRFRVTRAEYDVSGNRATWVPEMDLPAVDVVIAKPIIRQAREMARTDVPGVSLAVDYWS